MTYFCDASEYRFVLRVRLSIPLDGSGYNQLGTLMGRYRRSILHATKLASTTYVLADLSNSKEAKRAQIWSSFLY